MQTPTDISTVLSTYTDMVEQSLRAMLDEQSSDAMYKQMAYFFGFADEQLQPIETYGGKRYRSALCLLVADCYDCVEVALSAATSIETYHNFTLIHDDIEDRDTMRRGRPTVWSLWGINHGINTGDTQLLLSQQILHQAVAKYPDVYIPIQIFMGDCYKQVLEGQFLDFTLTDLAIGDAQVTVESYLEMIGKKTSVLVACATRAGAMASGLDDTATQAWWDYGYNLGMAYQICDDTFSIWASSGVTGKQDYGDIIEQKKTLPVLRAIEQLEGTDRDQLLSVYNQTDPVTQDQAMQAVRLIEKTDAHAHCIEQIQQYSGASLDALGSLQLTQKQTDTFHALNQALLPNVKTVV